MDPYSVGQQPMSPTDPASRSGHEYPLQGSQSNISSSTQPASNIIKNVGFLKGIGLGAQNHVTRDGQIPKRRGPKPDSKPAQTPRQERSRQSQRTHRQRKEQYIRNLEIELGKLTQKYLDDTTGRDDIIHYKNSLAEQQAEIILLKDMLKDHGIAFQSELESRKATMVMQPRSGSTPQSNISSRSASYGQLSPNMMPSSGRSPQSSKSQKYSNGSLSFTSPMPTGGQSFHSHSPAEPGVLERSVKEESPSISTKLPGVFGRDLQLGIDFILALEATCRDHGEYLVRRSVDSPDTAEEAQFSGHAMMACCPPPTHISTVAARQEGLDPTYPHQVPDYPAETLIRLFDLGEKIAGEGHMEGGQVTPVMALKHLMSHPQYLELNSEDVRFMTQSVKKKVRCYGFGAVMEDFEVRDAVQAIFASKYGHFAGEYGSEDQLRADDL